MAATVYPSTTDTGPGMHTGTYPRTLMSDFDFRDNRYPSLTAQSKVPQSTNAVLLGSQTMPAWEKEAKEDDEYFKERPSTADPATASSQDWSPPEQKSSFSPQQPQAGASSAQSNQSQGQSQEQPKSAVSYSIPNGTPRRVVERYSLDNDPQLSTSQVPVAADAETALESSSANRTAVPQPRRQGPPDPTIPSAPRHPSLPAAGIGAGPSNANGNAASSPSFMPLSASPTYNPPVSSRQRAYAQQPTFIQNVSPQPVNPVYLPNNPPEEVCLECAMRDQDMADVDVTSPGVWDRDSDVLYEELKRREEEEEATGVINTETPPRPRAKGGKLTEQNLKLWLSVNPREPTSRQQTLNAYVKSQRVLLEAEAAAHTRAMQEARQLDSKMRDAYSQLRRSAYDLGSSAAPSDDTGGIRIKPPSSPTAAVFTTAHERSGSRDITLLENGMIVEHVDVRKEEREARSRQRREDRRARKSSRSSAIDVNSLVSSPQTDSSVGLNPYNRHSQASSARPMSVLTAPFDARPDLPRAYSQASFSDMHSLNSASPRRSRFFGTRTSGWLSQDSLAPSGMSGSMVDMHVALQRDATRNQMVQSPVDITRRSQYWPNIELEPTQSRQSSQAKKKKKGLAKIWSIVTRTGKSDKNQPQDERSPTVEKTDDDLPLAPPPPLSYLVNRGVPGDALSGSPRHASTPSLISSISPKFGMSSSVSPPTATSSSIPSPTSSRQSGADQDTVGAEAKPNNNLDVSEGRVNDRAPSPSPKNAQSEPDLRGRISPSVPTAALPNTVNTLTPHNLTPVAREKSLPPLPPEAIPRPNANLVDARPRTMYTFDSRQNGSHDFLPPQAPFRTGEVRRQSFGGMASRPKIENLLSKSTNGRMTPDTRRGFTANYDEFGSSRRSLGLRDFMSSPMRHSVAGTPGPTKRKSKFGLSSLFGRKSPAPDKELNQEYAVYAFPQTSTHKSVSDAPGDDGMTYATSASRHSVLSTGSPAAQRMSVTSRKALEELVAQDSDFVAYRYPSQGQRLDLFTR
ncbi:proteophosphoglycan ppg4 [Moniliophthora roreri]|nr:proteophosphoglycan ppg4 [Moniliophthora roreri]